MKITSVLQVKRDSIIDIVTTIEFKCTYLARLTITKHKYYEKFHGINFMKKELLREQVKIDVFEGRKMLFIKFMPEN